MIPSKGLRVSCRLGRLIKTSAVGSYKRHANLPAASTSHYHRRPLIIASSESSLFSLSISSTPTSTLSFLDSDMAASPLCPLVQGSELWITYHQASRTHKQVTAQLVDVSDAAQLFDLEDVLDYIFQQGFVDAKWRSVSWWEDNTAVRLKASSTVQDLLARGAGSTAENSLHLIVGTWGVLFTLEWDLDLTIMLT